jgi:hypothetical protein
MINDLFEPPPTWWEIIKEIISDVLTYWRTKGSP